jgi:hypothetical protein
MSTSVSRRSPSAVHPTRQQLDDLDALLKRMLDLPVNRLEDETDDEAGAPPSAEEEVGPTPLMSAPEPIRGPHRPAFARAPGAEAAAPSVNYNTTDATEADLKPRVIIVTSNSPANETNSAAEAAAQAAPATAEETSQRGHAEDWVPLTSSWRPSSRTWKPLTEAWEQAQGIDKETGRQGDKETRRQGDKETSGEHGQVSEPGSVVELETHSVPLVSLSPCLLVSLSSADSRPTQRATPPPSPPELMPWSLWPVVAFNYVFDACLAPWGPAGRWLKGPTGRALLGILGLLCLTAAAALAAADWIGWTS